MNSQDFHTQAQKYAISRIKDKITGDKHREKIYLLGNTAPKWEPQGSFNRMSYGVSGSRDGKTYMSGGSRTQQQQTFLQQKLNDRANQMRAMTGTEETILPGATDQRPTPRSTEKTELELFFGDLTSLNFTANNIPIKEIKKAITNLRLSGLSLNVNTLIRFRDISEDSINLFIQNVQQNKDLNFKTAFDNFRVSEEPKIYNYIQNLQTLPVFELIYKIYLILVSLINNYNLSTEDREQIFTQHYQEILKARPSNLFNGETQTAFDLAEDQIKELKDIMPKNFYDAMFKRGKLSLKDLIKIRPMEEDNIQEAVQKINNIELDISSDDEFEVDSSTDDEDVIPDQGQAFPDLTKREITNIKSRTTRETKKYINGEIKKIQFPITDDEEADISKAIYVNAVEIIQTNMGNLIKSQDEFQERLDKTAGLIFPVISAKNERAQNKR